MKKNNNDFVRLTSKKGNLSPKNLPANNKKDLVAEKSFNKKLTHKKVILGSLATTMVAIPTMVGISQMAITNEKYAINGKLYASKESAINAVLKDATVETYKKENGNAVWKINVPGEKESKVFNNVDKMKEFIFSKYISKNDYVTHFNVPTDINTGKILLSDLEFSQLQKINSPSDIKRQIVYGANNDSFYASKIINDIDQGKELAYASYFKVKDGYYFNNMFFNSLESLRIYLLTDYLPNIRENVKANSFVIEAPNGVKSNPITFDNPQNFDTTYLDKFIRNNSITVLQYTNSKTKETHTFDKDNLYEKIDKVNLTDLSYLHVQSNQGESRYIIDNHYSDDHNLIGPYFYKGNLDIGAITNRDMWRKTNNINKAVYVESKVDTTIGSYFTSIINDDPVSTRVEYDQQGKLPVLFRTLLTTSDGKNLDDWFMEELGRRSPRLQKELVENVLNLIEGKKYNTFFKIPVLYSFIMQRVINYGLDNGVVNLVINYFNKVLGFIQDAIELTLMDEGTEVNSILKGSNDKIFNAIDFFQIGNPEYDLNTAPEYFLQELKQNYPKLVAAMSIYVAATNNLFSMGGLIPFAGIDVEFLKDFKIINDLDFELIKDKLKFIYDAFSTSDYSIFLDRYIPNTSIQSLKALNGVPRGEWEAKIDALETTYSKTSMGMMLKGIGLRNNQYHEMANSLLDTEIQIYRSTGQFLNNGYLSRLFSTNSRVDKLHPFLLFVQNNPDVDLYYVYLSYLIDKRASTNIFGSTPPKDALAFAQAVSRLTFAALGSSYLVGTSMKKLYSNYSSRYFNTRNNILNPNENSPLPRVENHQLWDLIEQIDVNDLPKLDSTYTPSTRGRQYVEGFDIRRLRPVAVNLATYEKYFDTHDRSIMEITPHRNNSFIVLKNGAWAYKDGSYTHFPGVNAGQLPRPEVPEIGGGGNRPNGGSGDGNNNGTGSGSGTGGSGSGSGSGSGGSGNGSGTGGSGSGSGSGSGESGGSGSGSGSGSGGSGGSGSGSGSGSGGSGGSGSGSGGSGNGSGTGGSGSGNGSGGSGTGGSGSGNGSGGSGTGGSGNGSGTGGSGSGSGNGSGGSGTGGSGSGNGSGGSGNGSGTGGSGSGSGNGSGGSGTGGSGSGNGSGGSGNGSGTGSGGNSNSNSNNGSIGGSKPNRPPVNQDGTIGNGISKRPSVVIGPDGHTKLDGASVLSVDNPSLGAAKKGHKRFKFGTKRSGKYTVNAQQRWSGTSVFNTIKDYGKVVFEYLGEIFGVAFAAAEFVFLILDLLKVEEIQDFYVYTLIDGTEIIWDGGKTVSKFFGTQTDVTVGISDMKLLTPIQITLPQIEEFYYFNQVRYYDVRDLKISFIQQSINNPELLEGNKNFTKKVTFNRADVNGDYAGLFDTHEEIIKEVYDSIGITKAANGTTSINLKKDSKYVSNFSYGFSNGVHTDRFDSENEVIAKNVTDNIRVTKVLQLPKMVNGVIQAPSTENFVYPGIVWTPSGIRDNTSKLNDYLVDYSANQLKSSSSDTVTSKNLISPSDYLIENKKEAETNSLAQLYKTFKSIAQLKTKNALANQVLITNKFSDLDINISSASIYSLTIPGLNSTVKFLDVISAERYLWKYLDVSKISQYDVHKKIIYNGYVFETEEELANWVTNQKI